MGVGDEGVHRSRGGVARVVAPHRLLDLRAAIGERFGVARVLQHVEGQIVQHALDGLVVW